MRFLSDENNERCYIHNRTAIRTCPNCGRGMCKKCFSLSLSNHWRTNSCPSCRLGSLEGMKSTRVGQLIFCIILCIVLVAAAIIFTPVYVAFVVAKMQAGIELHEILFSSANIMFTLIFYLSSLTCFFSTRFIRNKSSHNVCIVLSLVFIAFAIALSPNCLSSIQQMQQAGATLWEIFSSAVSPVLLLFCYILIILCVVFMIRLVSSIRFFDKEVDDVNDLL